MKHLAKNTRSNPTIPDVLAAFPSFDNAPPSIPMLRRHFGITKHTARSLRLLTLRHVRAANGIPAKVRKVMQECGVNEAEARWWLENGGGQ